MAIVCFIIEERICQLAAEQCKHFIRAAESGEVDGAVVLEDGYLNAKTGDAERLFHLCRTASGKAIMAGVDIKVVMLASDNVKGGVFSFGISLRQRESCEALILCNPMEPDFVVLLPIYYVPERTAWEKKKGKGGSVNMPPFREPWALHPAAGFPSEYVSFITPVRLLGKALECMRASMKDKDTP
ncbi:MAG: hypothetical protein Q9198_007034 [Flavoplaca austrocitrina]